MKKSELKLIIKEHIKSILKEETETIHKFPRYTTWTDEMSGIGGKYRPTTYGVYDNKKETCAYTKELDSTNRDYSKAKALAKKMNDELENPLKY